MANALATPKKQDTIDFTTYTIRVVKLPKLLESTRGDYYKLECSGPEGVYTWSESWDQERQAKPWHIDLFIAEANDMREQCGEPEFTLDEIATFRKFCAGEIESGLKQYDVRTALANFIEGYRAAQAKQN